MKRRIFKIVLFLLLGAAVNVAVAWGCSLWSPHSPSSNGYIGTNPLCWYFKIEQGFGLERVVMNANLSIFAKISAPAPDYVETDIAWYDRYEPFTATQLYITTGWPCYSFRSKTLVFEPRHIDIPPITVPDYPKVSWQAGLILKVNTPRKPIVSNGRTIGQIPHVLPSKILPLRPLLLGLLLNTIFYSALVWLAVFAPFKLRRYVRQKRGMCTKCGYDLRGTDHDNCPECGWGRDKLLNKPSKSIKNPPSDPR